MRLFFSHRRQKNMTSRLGNIEAGVRMTDQQPLVGVQIGPDFSPDIWTDLESAPRGTREKDLVREIEVLSLFLVIS